MMEEKDLEQIITIENICFPFPWSPASFQGELIKEDGLHYVAEYQNRIIGYAIGWMVVDEIHIGNVAVHPDYRYRGIGKRLVEKMLQYKAHMKKAALEVRRSNHAARMLYKSVCKASLWASLGKK